jgi:hypothetical protein
MAAERLASIGLTAGLGALAVGAVVLWDKFKAGEDPLDVTARGLEKIEQIASDFKSTLDQVTGALTNSTTEMAAGEFQALGLADELKEAGLEGEAFAEAIAEWVEPWDASDKAANRATDTMTGFIDSLDDGTEESKALIAEILRLKIGLEASQSAITETEDIMRELETQAEDTADEIENLEDAWGELVDELLGSSDSFISTREFMEDLKEAGEDINELSYAEARREIDDLAGEYAARIGEMVDEGRTIEEIQGFAATARFGLLDLMNQAGFSATEIERVFDALNAVDGKAVSATITTHHVQTGNKTGGITVGQHGGIVRRPTFALIGEAGPEAVIPLSQAPGASPLPNFGTAGGSVTVPIQVVLPDGRVLAEVVAEANLESGGQFE